MASRTAAHAATVEPKVTVMDGFEMRDEAKPAPTLVLRAARLGAGEAQVEAERDEVTLPAEELRTATTLRRTRPGVTIYKSSWPLMQA